VTQVEIEIPSRSVYVGVVRLALAALARSAGLNEESVDDLKIAVGEACANAVIVNEETAPDVPVKVYWSHEDSRVVVEVEGAGHQYDSSKAERDDDDLAARMEMSVALLESLVDACEITEHRGGTRTARLTVNL
jgi:serine/threonine-protein kinase RsbW